MTLRDYCSLHLFAVIFCLSGLVLQMSNKDNIWVSFQLAMTIPLKEMVQKKKKKKPQRNLITFVSSLDWFLPNKRSTSKVSDVRDPAMTVNHLFWPLNLSHLNAQSLNISCSRNIIIEKSTKYRIVSFRWKERQISKEGGT